MKKETFYELTYKEWVMEEFLRKKLQEAKEKEILESLIPKTELQFDF